MIPGVRRLQERERQLASEISEAQYREVEYRGHRQSRKRNCETEVGSSTFEKDLEVTGLTNDSNSQSNTEFIKRIKELTEERTKLREEVTELRRDAPSAHASTDSEKQMEINSLDMKMVSLSVTFEQKDTMTNNINLDLNRSESHVGRLVQQNRDH